MEIVSLSFFSVYSKRATCNVCLVSLFTKQIISGIFQDCTCCSQGQQQLLSSKPPPPGSRWVAIRALSAPYFIFSLPVLNTAFYKAINYVHFLPGRRSVPRRCQKEWMHRCKQFLYLWSHITIVLMLEE